MPNTRCRVDHLILNRDLLIPKILPDGLLQLDQLLRQVIATAKDSVDERCSLFFRRRCGRCEVRVAERLHEQMRREVREQLGDGLQPL